MKNIKTVAVIGAGTMGNGIAHVMAQYGHRVTLIDISQDALGKALQSIEKNLGRQVSKQVITEETKNTALKNISTSTSIKEGVKEAELVIEAVSENISIKQQLFRELVSLIGTETILATNTSSISITQIASVTGRGKKVIGMHFMNPVPMMKLVEVIRGYETDAESLETILALCEKIGKTAVVVQDYPGFVANRILMPMINESIWALYEGVAKVEDIDTVMKLGMAHPMGPFQLADFIGLDVCLSILKVLHEGFGNPKYAPCPLLVNMVMAGHKGVKTGCGFYTYSQGATMVSSRFQ